MRQIVRMVYGSHLFGNSIETSDRDFKAVCLPSAKDILLQKVLHIKRNGSRKERNLPEQEDIEFLSLQQYLKMLCEGQTIAVDMAFVPERFYVPGTVGSEWYAVRNNLGRFLHSGVDIFTGFAASQARRYSVKANRLSALEEAHGFFGAMGAMYGASTKIKYVKLDLLSMIAGYPPEIMSLPRIANAGRRGVPIEHFECCDRKIPLGSTLKEAENVYKKATQFYGKRARLAQQMGGQDWKAMSHAVRIVREAGELLLTGRITFPRPEASLLLAIRRGKLQHAVVLDLIESGLEMVAQAKLTADLPEQPDWSFADQLVESFYRSQVADPEIESPRSSEDRASVS